LTYRYVSDRLLGVKLNGQALKAIRERSGLSQSELARATGLSQGRISELESESPNIRPSTSKALADALKVPVVALLVDEPVAS